MKRALAVVVVLGAIVLVAVLEYRRNGGSDKNGSLAASGTVEATDAQLGFQAAGRLAEVLPAEGARVEAGALLATLDISEARARRAQAQAQVESADERLADARRDLARATRLHEAGAASREALDKAGMTETVARSQAAQARAALAAVDAGIQYMRIAAPFAGLVTVRHREPGEVVAPGAPVLTLMNPADRWVRIYVREDRVGVLRLGGRAAIRSDTFPDKRYAGEVANIASEAEFTPKNVQTQEERVRLVYAVKVRILEDPAMELKPGMPVDVELEGPQADRGAK